MIRENIECNEGVKTNTEFLNELRNKLPEFFINEKIDEEGNVVSGASFDIEKFQQSLKDNNINELKEGYQLSFIGKDYAKKQSGEKPTTAVIPDIKHNNEEINCNSKNLFFTGDNLEVLRHLKNNYRNSVDVIYIDPPYNTGSDGFVYPDKFEYSDEVLQNMFALNEEELNRLKSIQGKATHSAWLSFMYPRLSVAKQLLKDTGVIFISIDDNEYSNLKLLCDEIFGEINFIAELVWQKNFAPKNDNKYISKSTESILCISKSKDYFEVGLIPREDKHNKDYKNPDNDPRGVWTSGSMLATTFSYSGVFDIISPNGQLHSPIAGRCWRFSKSKIDDLMKDNRIWFGKDGNGVPRIKRFLSEMKDGIVPQNILLYSDVGSNQDGNLDLKKLFDEELFSFPKCIKLIKHILTLGNTKDGIVLDFFAGSATTAHATMQLNADDSGKRQFIMVQLDEPTWELNSNGEKIARKGSETAFNAGYMSIDEISRERIKRASIKIKEEKGLLLPENFDGGFKHYHVVKPKQSSLDDLEYFDFDSGMFRDKNGYSRGFSEDNFDDMINPFSSSFLGVGGETSGSETIITTWIIQDGYKLDHEIKNENLIGYDYYYVEESRIYLIDKGWSAQHTKELLNKIGNYELNVQSIVIYAYSFDLESIRELEIGLKQLNKKVNLVKRY